MRYTERWKPVVGYEGRYEVSDLGHVRSYLMNSGQLREQPRLLRIVANRSKTSKLRYVVNLNRDRRRTRHYVGRLVLTAFRGPCPEGMESLHRDDDASNNALSNLRWGTPKENAADALRNRRRQPGKTARLTTGDVAVIRTRLAAGDTQAEIARDYTVARGTINAIKTGRFWKTTCAT